MTTNPQHCKTQVKRKIERGHLDLWGRAALPSIAAYHHSYSCLEIEGVDSVEDHPLATLT
ncbi:MAG: hypothetical protein ACO3NK_05010 [Prochlorotrichaceae cyanobacterium]|jgi:hypothetical protein